MRRCGLVLDTDHRYLGASPDGKVFDATAIPRFGLLEVKCPFVALERSLSLSSKRRKRIVVSASLASAL